MSDAGLRRRRTHHGELRHAQKVREKRGVRGLLDQFSWMRHHQKLKFEGVTSW